MKAAKITTLIAAILFLLSGAGIIWQLPPLASIIADNTAGPHASPYIAPVVDFIFATISFAFWFYLRMRERRGKLPSQASLAGIVLLVLSMFLPVVLLIWFVLLPIYNLSSSAS